MSISILLPAYQEAENIPFIAPRIHSVLKYLNIPYEILILDTAKAMDNTAELCGQYGLTHCPRIGGDSYGAAIRTGIAAAQHEYTIIMDCDGSHDPEDIAVFWNLRKQADLIIGSRYVKGGKTDNSPILILMSWLVNLAYRIILGLRVKDVSNSFRMYTSLQLKKLDLECDNFDLVEEILIKLILDNPELTILETPIAFEKRNRGVSKRSLLKFIASYAVTLWKLWNIKRSHKKEKSC